MPKATYSLSMPEIRSTSVIFASPHSGRDYPWAFLRKSILDERTIRSSEDAFVDQLFAPVTAFGAPLLVAHAPRAFVDLNRSADELDPALIRDVPRSAHNPRVTSGLGVIPRVVANGRTIYRGKMPLKEAEARLSTYWHPYHDALAQLTRESQAMFGEAILIDCHSMPHEALDSIHYPTGKRPEVVLGDRFGAAASSDVVDRIEAAFAEAGFTVIRNAPFAGAFTTQHYGRPSINQHVVQVEIDRALYMNESMIRPNANFNAVRDALTQVAAAIADIGSASLPLAAE